MSQNNNKTLNVTWDDHLQNLSGLFQDLYENKKLCDVTLYCSGGSFLKAHKLVLSACSPYFAKIFQEIEMKHPVVILKGISYEEMHRLLEFMYKGSINILEQELPALIQAGSYLEIKGMDAKNIPVNIRNNLKRTFDLIDNNSENAKKLKEGGQTEVVKQEHLSRDSSPANSLRRETRFKGQKRVDVRFRGEKSAASPLSTSYKKKEPDEDKETAADDADKTLKIEESHAKINIKGKSNKKTINIKSDTSTTEKDSNTNKTQQNKPKPQTEKNNKNNSEVIKKNKPDLNNTSDEDGVSKLIIKDVYSTGDQNTNSNSNKQDKDESGDEDDDKDDMFTDMEDDTLIPDINFRECDEELNVGHLEGGHVHNTETSEHLNVNYMECSFCNMTFKNDNDLFCHQKVHTETKPFKCDFCESYFQRSSHLARHRRKHIGDRPYECKTCGKAFSRSDKLRTHCRQTHDDDYQPPPHLKKKYEFVEYTGENMEKKGRGRPRKLPFDTTIIKPPKIDGEKRGRGRPRKMSCPAPGEPVENYDITNLPFGDFSYLTESLHLASENTEAYHDISIIPVATSSANTSINIPSSTATESEKTEIVEKPQPLNETKPSIEKTNSTETTCITDENIEILTNIRQIGECTIQPVGK